MNEALVAVEGSERAPAPGARALGPSHKEEWIEVTVKVKRRAELPTLDAAPATILSGQELAERYGADPADIAKVTDAFKALGLQVIEANASTCSVKLGGTAEQMQRAFGVSGWGEARERVSLEMTRAADARPSLILTLHEVHYGTRTGMICSEPSKNTRSFTRTVLPCAGTSAS